jgi:class 3 adenylate cyclase
MTGIGWHRYEVLSVWGGLLSRCQVLRAVRGSAQLQLPVMRSRHPPNTTSAASAGRLASPGFREPAAQNFETRGRLSTLPGEMKQVTVLFCDIVNSTPLTERLGAEGMRDLVHGFLGSSLAIGKVEVMPFGP